MAAYSLTHEAEADLRDIWRYTAETWGPDQADAYLRRIHKRLETLLSRPSRGITGLSEPVHFQRQQGHHIYFTERDGTPLVIAILHQRTDLQNRLKGRL